MKAVLENIERILKGKRKDKHARYVALDIVRQELRKLKEPAGTLYISNTIDADVRKLNAQQKYQIGCAIREGKKIEAIKLLRTLTGCGLKDGKDIIELHQEFEIYRTPGWVRQTTPANFGGAYKFQRGKK